MHQLLGDATDVDAGASEAPGGALGGGLDEIQARHLGAELGSLLGGRLRRNIGGIGEVRTIFGTRVGRANVRRAGSARRRRRAFLKKDKCQAVGSGSAGDGEKVERTRPPEPPPMTTRS